MSNINKLKQLIEQTNSIVFFGGAGVSTESGIPDFRGKNGLYNQTSKYNPEKILNREFLSENPEDFFEFYKQNLICLDAMPNATHYALAKLEKIGKLKYVITQNIDGLHQKAGSQNVIELHGSIHNNFCKKCKRIFTQQQIFNKDGVPRCECGGIIRPDIVLYGENLKRENIDKAVDAIRNCDLLIVGGTSLVVRPASTYLNDFRGENLVIINQDSTPYDNEASLVINESLGKVFEEIMKYFN